MKLIIDVYGNMLLQDVDEVWNELNVVLNIVAKFINWQIQKQIERCCIWNMKLNIDV